MLGHRDLPTFAGKITTASYGSGIRPMEGAKEEAACPSTALRRSAATLLHECLPWVTFLMSNSSPSRTPCRCSVKMSSPRGYQSRRAREKTGPRAEGVPSGADVDVECFYDLAAVIGCPPNTSCQSSLLAIQLGGDTFTDQLEG
jgi:hypothetical protein